MDIKDMIDRYGLRLATRFDGGKLVKTGNILISRPQQVQEDNALADIKAAKPKIIACLEAQEARKGGTGRTGTQDRRYSRPERNPGRTGRRGRLE